MISKPESSDSPTRSNTDLDENSLDLLSYMSVSNLWNSSLGLPWQSRVTIIEDAKPFRELRESADVTQIYSRAEFEEFVSVV